MVPHFLDHNCISSSATASTTIEISVPEFTPATMITIRFYALHPKLRNRTTLLYWEWTRELTVLASLKVFRPRETAAVSGN